MAIIPGQRVLRKSMAADVIREWAPIAKDEWQWPSRRVACRFLRGTQRGHNSGNVSCVTLGRRVRRY